MDKTILVLPDLTEISSGVGKASALASCKITEAVNAGQDLAPGSVCAAMAEITVIAPGGAFGIQAGSEFTIYREIGSIRRKVGVFIAEQPTRASANTFKLTAYDRIIRLEKDLTGWLSALDGWPYTVAQFAEMVCTQCGLTFQPLPVGTPNRDYQIPRFLASGVTGRRLLGMAAQVANRYVRATPDGEISFGWYEDRGTILTPGGDNYIFGGSLKYEDYTIPPIDRVQIQLTENDVGVFYPPNRTGENVYKVTGNYLLTATQPDQLLPVAEEIFLAMQAVTYTPCKVSAPSSTGIRAGDIVSIRDANGATITTYVMRTVVAGQKCSLDSTGNRLRKAEHTVLDEKFGAVHAKMLEISKSVQGISVKATDLEKKVSSQEEQISDINVRAGTIESIVSSNKTASDDQIGSLNEEIVKISKQVSQQITADQIRTEITTERQNAEETLRTTTGITMDERGVTVDKTGASTVSNMSENGLSITEGQNKVLTAVNPGVDARNLRATTYLIVGGRIRMQNYWHDRGPGVACFWVGG